MRQLFGRKKTYKIEIIAETDKGADFALFTNSFINIYRDFPCICLIVFKVFCCRLFVCGDGFSVNAAFVCDKEEDKC